jgi:hypothetical protein
MTTFKPIRKRRTIKQIKKFQLQFPELGPQLQRKTEGPPVKKPSNPPIVSQCPDWTPAVAAEFEREKKDRMKGITGNDHLPSSQKFSAVTDDPQPTGSET